MDMVDINKETMIITGSKKEIYDAWNFIKEFNYTVLINYPVINGFEWIVDKSTNKNKESK